MMFCTLKNDESIDSKSAWEYGPKNDASVCPSYGIVKEMHHDVDIVFWREDETMC